MDMDIAIFSLHKDSQKVTKISIDQVISNDQVIYWCRGLNEWVNGEEFKRSHQEILKSRELIVNPPIKLVDDGKEVKKNKVTKKKLVR